MYGDNGALMRSELAALLRQHRIQQRLGEASANAGTSNQSAVEREGVGRQVRQYRHTILAWCAQAVLAAKPLVFSASLPAPANPFRAASDAGTAVGELARALHHAYDESSAGHASMQLLTTPSDNPLVEHWRHAARAAALAEHDTNGSAGARLTAAQAEALVGDVAAVTQALVVLDRRYANTPGWEKLAQTGRLGWAALASGLDVSLGQPDYGVDQAGWRPRTRTLRGPVRPGLLGVLQAEHNLLVRLRFFPNAMNLRRIVDSQRQLSGQLAPLAQRIDPQTAKRWTARAATYALILKQLRDIGGRLGTGGAAVAEAANATARLRAVPADTILEPRVLAAFQTLFDRLDHRIADLVEDGVNRGAFLQRVKVPAIAPNARNLVHQVEDKFVPVTRISDLAVGRTIHERLRPPPPKVGPSSPGTSRADLHAAIVHRPLQQGVSPDVPNL